MTKINNLFFLDFVYNIEQMIRIHCCYLAGIDVGVKLVMMGKDIWLILFFAGMLCAGESSLVLNYDFTAGVIRQGGSYAQPVLSPELRIAVPEQALILTGEQGQHELLVPDSTGFSIEDGCTFYALVKFEQDGTKASQNDSHEIGRAHV